MNQDASIISVHHVGGRAGTRGFPVIPNIFEGDLENVYYDADADCVEQIEDRLKVLSRKVVLPYCIDGVNGARTFYIMADRYESTLIRPQPSHDFLAVPGLGWDQDLQGVVDEIRDVETAALDSIFQKPDAPANPPDFLSLDTEGTEPQILEGASQLLQHDVIGLQTEVNLEHTFNPLNRILSQSGFQLLDVKVFETPFRYSEQIPIGLRGVQGTGPEYGETIYIKNPQMILTQHQDPWLDLLKGAFIAFLHGKLPVMYAFLKAFENLENAQADLEKKCSLRKYLEFLRNFMICRKSYPFIVPLRFSTVCHTPQIRTERFQKIFKEPSGRELRQRYFEYVDREQFKKSIPVLFKEDYIALEQICINYGFQETADRLKKRRLHDVIMLLLKLELAQKKDDAIQLSLDDLKTL
ncbi:MAG: FkbM family methyltransferase [Sedimentisphaerales bacterium]|nr:FkbM family methyltransferase [Sedimentisphaerales bacterium]